MEDRYVITRHRRHTKAISVGGVQIGGGAPVVVQSMTNTDTCQVDTTLSQIERLAAAGCEVVRLAIPNHEAVQAFKEIRAASPVPL
ncbi:MAG: flavodoxin-dependent (E)-4-hydroxy-3-methylbut-2-enyl-diphosphate synthase, partial [Deltaproteobacteria bacterium]|nr:flavodoxin-dependent (E)-4-hydroxy-3-methylbut-2-enyl-diphosphate synthase [Deltaproteobacteria bacterium]